METNHTEVFVRSFLQCLITLVLIEKHIYLLFGKINPSNSGSDKALPF